LGIVRTTANAVYEDGPALSPKQPPKYDIRQLFGVVEDYVGDATLIDTPLGAPVIVQKKMMEPFTGFDNGTTNTQIYTGGRNAFQGLATITVSGIPKLIASQRVAGTAWTVGEQIRLLQYEIAGDGSVVTNDFYTAVMNLGHGYDISAVQSGATVKLYTSLPTVIGAEDTEAGKGFCEIAWNGASTVDANVTSYKVFGTSGSGHPFAIYNRCGVAVSPNGKYVVLAAVRTNGQRTVFVYDLAAVKALGNPLDARPLYVFNIEVRTPEGASAIQGIHCERGLIYIMRGGTAPFGTHEILMYSLDGNLLRRSTIDDGRAQYGIAGLLNNGTHGNPARFEPEGLTMHSGQLLMSCTESWRSGAKIVSYRGKNWAASSLNSVTTGIEPQNGSYWTRTTKATTDGPWNSSTDYGNGTNYSLEKKTIYAIGAPTGASGEEAINGFITDNTSGAAVYTDGSDFSTQFPWQADWLLTGYSERLGISINGAGYSSTSQWKVYDQREGSENDHFVSMIASFGTTKAMLIRAKNGSTSFGAGVNYYADDDPSHPHSIREFTNNITRRKTDATGATVWTADAGATAFTTNNSTGSTYDKVQSYQRAGVEVYAKWVGTGTPEANVTAPRGSDYTALDTGKVYTRQTGAGTIATGWVVTGTQT
jgi:hypothetical protein